MPSMHWDRQAILLPFADCLVGWLDPVFRDLLQVPFSGMTVAHPKHLDCSHLGQADNDFVEVLFTGGHENPLDAAFNCFYCRVPSGTWYVKISLNNGVNSCGPLFRFSP